jgi:membrane protease YdiL (CAAX protease family)
LSDPGDHEPENVSDLPQAAPSDQAPDRPPDEGLDAPPLPSRNASPEPARPGLRTFTLEGRTAPGLFVVGWLATIMGAGVLFIAVQPAVPETPAAVLTLTALALLSIGIVSGAGSQAIERRHRGETYTGPSPFLVFAAVVPVASLLVALVGIPAVALGLAPDSPGARLLSLGVQVVVYIGLVRLLVVGTGALTWSDMGIGRRPGRLLIEDIGWGVLAAAPVILATAFLAAALASFLPLPDSPLPPSGDNLGLVLNLVTAAILAPIGEEAFFRGFATTAWARSMSPAWAIVRSALFFAAVHVITVGGSSFGDAALRALAAFIARLPVAFVLGYLFMRRRSLASSIALHATFNGLLVLLAEAAIRAG